MSRVSEEGVVPASGSGGSGGACCRQLPAQALGRAPQDRSLCGVRVKLLALQLRTCQQADARCCAQESLRSSRHRGPRAGSFAAAFKPRWLPACGGGRASPTAAVNSEIADRRLHDSPACAQGPGTIDCRLEQLGCLQGSRMPPPAATSGMSSMSRSHSSSRGTQRCWHCWQCWVEAGGNPSANPA